MQKIQRIILSIAIIGVLGALIAPAPVLAADYWIYEDALTSGWNSWSWGGSVNFSESTTIQSGARSIKFSSTAKWGTLSLQSTTAVTGLTQYAGVEFYAHGGAAKELLWAYLTDSSGKRISPIFALGQTSGSWQKFFVPIESFNVSSFSGLNIQTDSIGDFYVDSLRLIAPENMPPAPSRTIGRKVAGNLVFWDSGLGFQTIRNNLDAITEVSPVWYVFDSAGNVVPYRDSTGASYEDAGVVKYLKSNNILVTPTITNYISGAWQVSLTQNILNNPQLRAAHISSIVSLTVSKGYDGMDLDYENLTATDREIFSTFVRELADALHAQGKTLAVNLHAKTSEPGHWYGPQSQDWQAIGQAADQARIMVYDYSYSTSAPGPIAPTTWTSEVLAFGVSRIPPAKVIHGIPAYGYDWVGTTGTGYQWVEITDIVKQFGATLQWDSTSQTPWFRYTSGSTNHEVWFENAASTDAKLALTNSHNVGGINIWRFGGEDPETWSKIRARFGGVTPPPPSDPLPPTPPPPTEADTETPNVVITKPLNGSSTKSGSVIAIAASATDNVGVTSVEFSAGGRLLATDTAAPYEASWNTRKVAAGNYVIKAVASDAAGNLANHEVTVDITATTKRKGAWLEAISRGFSSLFCSLGSCSR